MPPKAPDWWNKKWSLRSLSLMPVAAIYDRIVQYRWSHRNPYHSTLPVICIGNFTMGGAGKTPTAIYVSELLKSMGHTPVFLTRGYGGQIKGPHLVQTNETPKPDTAEDVGDEPLLLSQYGPVIVSAHRAKGAQFIESEKLGDVILMDDGFQNPSLYKDFSLIVVDGESLIGNGRVFPAGPLRASLTFQRGKADAVLFIGGSPEISLNMDCPQFHARLVPSEIGTNLKSQKVIAYCGIARPEKFHASLTSLGIEIAARHIFPDHHFFTEDEVNLILKEIEDTGHIAVTTEKDWVRLSSTQLPFSELKAKSTILAVELMPTQDSEEKLMENLERVLKEN